MRTNYTFCFLITALLTVSNAMASDHSFSEAAIWCEPIAIGGDTNHSDYPLRVTVLVNSDVPDKRLSGIEPAVALVSIPGAGEVFMALSGKATVAKGSARSFASQSKDTILKVEFLGGDLKSKIVMKSLDDGQWVEYYNGPATCYEYQAGSEGVHN